MAETTDACMSAAPHPIMDGIADFPASRRSLTITESWKEMVESKPMEVPKWLGIVATILAIALPLMGYAFGAGSKSSILDNIGIQVAAMTIKVDSVNASVQEIRSHAEARDEQFKNLNQRIDDLTSQQRILSDKIERLEMSRR